MSADVEWECRTCLALKGSDCICDASSEASRTFGMHWANDYALYHAVLSYARDLLRVQPGMTDQTLGRNVRDQVARWCLYSWEGPIGVSPAVLKMMASEVGDFNAVSELDVAEDVRYGLGVET
jgi:hypothetical protein